jgi:aquaporin Z
MAGRPAHEGFHWRIWGAELAATTVLVFAGVSVICVVFGRGSPAATLLPSHSLQLLVVGLLFSGCNSLLAVSSLGRLSGAHLNPAVTIAFRVIGRVSTSDVVGYLTAQLLGAVLGAALVRLAWGDVARSVQGGATAPTVSVPLAFVLEALMTALLVAVIFAFVSSARRARWTPLAIWPVIALLVWAGASYTGTSLNPVRSAGPALVFVKALDVLWIYLLAPTVGAVAVALAWRARDPETHPKTAKLFHDPRYPCSLATELPAAPAVTDRPASRLTSRLHPVTRRNE